MGNLLLALAIIFGGWWLMRKFANSQPTQVRKLARKVAGAAIVVVGLLLTVRCAFNVGLPFIMLGLGLIGETSLFPGGFSWPGGPSSERGQRASSPPPRRGSMTRDQALAVLGLKGQVSSQTVNDAYRRLMKDFHPDRGGSDYLAAQINEARDVLLQELGATT